MSGNKADFYRCGEIMITNFPGVKYKAIKRKFMYLFPKYLDSKLQDLLQRFWAV